MAGGILLDDRQLLIGVEVRLVEVERALDASRRQLSFEFGMAGTWRLKDNSLLSPHP